MEEQSTLAWLWYGDDEDSFLASLGRNLAVFTAGGVFGAAAWNLVKRAVDGHTDPTGQGRLARAKTYAEEREALNRLTVSRINDSVKETKKDF